MSENKCEITANERPRRRKRPEIQIYRPGALQQLKQAALNGSNGVKKDLIVQNNNVISKEKTPIVPKVSNIYESKSRGIDRNSHDSTPKSLHGSAKSTVDRPIISSDSNSIHNTEINVSSKSYNDQPVRNNYSTEKHDINVSTKSEHKKMKLNNHENTKADVQEASKSNTETPAKYTYRNRQSKGNNKSKFDDIDTSPPTGLQKDKDACENSVIKPAESNHHSRINSVWKKELIKGNLLDEKKKIKKNAQKNNPDVQKSNYQNKAARNDIPLSSSPDLTKNKNAQTGCVNPVSLTPIFQSHENISPRNIKSETLDPTQNVADLKTNSTFVIYNSCKPVNNAKQNFDFKSNEKLSDNQSYNKYKTELTNKMKILDLRTFENLQIKTPSKREQVTSMTRGGRKSGPKSNSMEKESCDDMYKLSYKKPPRNNSPISKHHVGFASTHAKDKYQAHPKKDESDDDCRTNAEPITIKRSDYNYDQNKTFSYDKKDINRRQNYSSNSEDEFAQSHMASGQNRYRRNKKSIDTGGGLYAMKKESPGVIAHSNTPMNRGIIHLPVTSSANDKLETSPKPQKVLFNPNNPLKPVFVNASPRDRTTLTNSNSFVTEPSKESDVNRSSCAGENINETNKVDPAMLHSLHKGEMDILYYINTNQLPQEFTRIMNIRNHLQNCYEKLLLNDMRLCQEKNIESSLWKSLYYLIIEKLRDYIQRDLSLGERSISTLHMVVNDGLQYLPQLISKLETTYNFSLEEHFKEDLTAQAGVKNRVKQAIHSCQKLLLALGDLARYKEQYCIHPNLSTAKKWYLRALQVQPRNGRPYNRLAVVAVNQKRALDIVYYYIRSLTAANPFVSARDSLVSVFEDIRKKYESNNPASSKYNPDTTMPMHRHAGKGRYEDMREETWIRPDSGITNQRTLSQSEIEDSNNDRMQELLKQPSEELMKHFLTSYLHCHGMLFSRVGLDCFHEVMSYTLDSFSALLQSGSSLLSAVHLVQIVAVNIFAIGNTQMKDGHLESNLRSAAQELALLLAQEMFGRLCATVVRLLPTNLNASAADAKTVTPFDLAAEEASSSAIESLYDNYSIMSSDPRKLFLADVFTYIPAIKSWCDWLLYHSSQWNPPAQSHDIPSSNNSWNSVAALATIVKQLGPSDVFMSDTRLDDGCSVTLPEDNYLKGFSLLLPADVDHDMAYIRSATSLERARDWLRLNKIKVCLTQFLCGVEPPILRLQKTDQGEIMVAVLSADVLEKSLEIVAANDRSSDELQSEGDTTLSDDDDLMEEDAPEIDSMESFFIRKNKIEKRERRHKKHQDRMSITLQMEIRPRVLVPDTNCFIKHLDLIKKIVENSPYEVMVPLVVIDELELLSRDTAVEKYGDAAHAVSVREGASSGLHFLRSTLNGDHCRNLKCVTSQGSILTSATFTDEIGDQKMTNDDRILCCCMHFFKDNNLRRPITEGVRRLYREVVLLTDDIHLRVKAYSNDVPVRNLSDFALWAGIK